jgi:hypothetical protein
LGVSLGAFWYVANPGPTFDGWHGLGWGAALDLGTPTVVRVALIASAIGLGALVAWGVGLRSSYWTDLWRAARARGAAGLFAAAAALALARLVDVPGLGPAGYWPRWAFDCGLVTFSAALVRVLRRGQGDGRRLALRLGLVGLAVWPALVAAGVGLTWYHRPIDRLRAVVPGRIYISAMPTRRGLVVAHSRHHFKTIINLFPEHTPWRSPRLPEEIDFARRYGLRYVGSPSDVAASNAFLDLTLRLARDPAAWPILVHCHGCMDRTPAWVGIYRFVVEGRPLDEILRFIEGHPGYRPKATVTLLYNRVLPRLAPERCRDDPTAALLRRCAEGTTDPYFEQLRDEHTRAANRAGAAGVSEETGSAAAGRLPSLTPRR